MVKRTRLIAIEDQKLQYLKLYALYKDTSVTEIVRQLIDNFIENNKEEIVNMQRIYIERQIQTLPLIAKKELTRQLNSTE